MEDNTDIEKKEEKKEKNGKKEYFFVGEEYQNRLNIFKELLEGLEKMDAIKIKELSNRTIHSASTKQDTDSIAIAVIVYAISKIIERKKYREYPSWPEFYKKIKKSLEKAYAALKEKNLEKFRESLNLISLAVKKLRGKLRDYIEQVFRKAQIAKGSRIYEHGISFSQTAEILDITLWELAEYVGQTGIGDVDLSVTKDVDERIKIAEKFFS